MIQFDLTDEGFQKSLSILRVKDPEKHDDLIRRFIEANGSDIELFMKDHEVRPLDQPHFFEPKMFASFNMTAHFSILGHFETDGGQPTGNITPVQFWKPLFLLPRD